MPREDPPDRSIHLPLNPAVDTSNDRLSATSSSLLLSTSSAHSVTISSSDGDVTPRALGGGSRHLPYITSSTTTTTTTGPGSCSESATDDIRHGMSQLSASSSTYAIPATIRHVSPVKNDTSERLYGARRGHEDDSDDEDDELELSDRADTSESHTKYHTDLPVATTAALPVVPVLTHAAPSSKELEEEDDEEYELNDVKEAIEYVLTQEKVIAKGILLQEQVDQLMRLDLKNMVSVMKHFEASDNHGTDIRWEVIAEIICAVSPDDDDDDEDFDEDGDDALPHAAGGRHHHCHPHSVNRQSMNHHHDDPSSGTSEHTHRSPTAAQQRRRSQLQDLQELAVQALVSQLSQYVEDESEIDYAHQKGAREKEEEADATEVGYEEEVIDEEHEEEPFIEEEILDDIEVIDEGDEGMEDDEEDDIVDETLNDGTDLFMEEEVLGDEEEEGDEEDDYWIEEEFDDLEFDDDDTFDSGRSFMADDASECTGFTIEARSVDCGSSVTYDDNVDDLSDDENDTNNDGDMSISVKEPHGRKRVDDGRNPDSDDDTLSRSSKKQRSTTQRSTTPRTPTLQQARSSTPNQRRQGRSGSMGGSDKELTPGSRGRRMVVRQPESNISQFLDSNRKDSKQDILRARSRSRKGPRSSSKGNNSVKGGARAGKDAAAARNVKPARPKKADPATEIHLHSAQRKFFRRSSLQGDMVIGNRNVSPEDVVSGFRTFSGLVEATSSSATKFVLDVTPMNLHMTKEKASSMPVKEFRKQLRSAKQISMTDLTRPKLWSSLELNQLSGRTSAAKKKTPSKRL